MRCNNCGREFEGDKLFCNECEKHMKANSSKNKVRELEELIENQNKLNDIENTKELTNLKDLVEQELRDNNDNFEKKEEIKTREEYQKKNASVTEEKKESDPNRKKKLLIIMISIVLSIIIFLIMGLIFLNKEAPEEKKETIDYEKELAIYGKAVEKVSKNYLEENNEIPTWKNIIELIDYKKYEVDCNIHNIYNDGSIYLNECKVNNKKVKSSYGEEKKEIKEGKKIQIHKKNLYDENYYYTDKEEKDSNLVGSITCKTEECSYVIGLDKYVVINEESKNYIYNYENDSMEFGPFALDDENNPNKNLLIYNNALYGVYYKENGEYNIYNINNGKTLKNIKGSLNIDEFMYNPSIMYKYNYVILTNNNENNFMNLKTGNISYTIKDNLGSFVEDSKNKIVYMTVYNNSSNKFKIYNSNGKLLFGGKEFTKFKLANDSILVSNERNYKLYDSNLNWKLTSKDYDEILGLYNDFIVVIDNNHLEILDLNEKKLATFEDEWSNNFQFHELISGWYTENGKNGIYLVVENKDIPYGTIGSGTEYYYIPTTGEIGKIETIGVGGYAKPVLYLYPKKEMKISVTFSDSSLLTTTYPKFKNKWSVTAKPNGDLYDSEGNYYYALYWEEQKNHQVDFKEGFYVTKDNAIEFLEEKLSIIGLNAKERNEFIMYWLPVLEKNKKSLVYFELTKERDSYNKLIIRPKPDSLLRVAMHVKKVNKKTSIKEEVLPKFDRKGFTAVEWGGVIY